jgi:hypothetical protein
MGRRYKMKIKTVKEFIDELKKFPDDMKVQLIHTVKTSDVLSDKRDDGSLWKWYSFDYDEWEYSQEFDDRLWIETNTVRCMSSGTSS